MFLGVLEGHAPSWPWTGVLTDATAARPSGNTFWLRPYGALGYGVGRSLCYWVVPALDCPTGKQA